MMIDINVTKYYEIFLLLGHISIQARYGLLLQMSWHILQSVCLSVSHDPEPAETSTPIKLLFRLVLPNDPCINRDSHHNLPSLTGRFILRRWCRDFLACLSSSILIGWPL